MRISSLAVLWLLFVSSGYAAPTPRHRAVGRMCEPTSPKSPRKLARRVKSFGGPVARPSTRAAAGLSDLTTFVKRATSAHRGAGDDEAIQNDAPAARIDGDETAAPELRPLGVLHGAIARFPLTRTSSPRSPRGPPTAALQRSNVSRLALCFRGDSCEWCSQISSRLADS